MKIALGCDHGGYAMKEDIKKQLEGMGHEVKDCGTYSTESCDYPIFGEAAARAVASGECEYGIVVCTTGIGISIAANKVRGIRCAHCADALEAQQVFPALMLGMIRAGEGSGRLDRVAERLAVHYEKAHQMNQQVKSALMYPMILAVLSVAVVIVIVTFVLPQFSDLFSTMDSLPAVTLALMAFSDFMVTIWYLLLLGLAALAAALRSLLHVPSVRLALDRAKLNMPVFGPLHRIICTARFARTISSLYASGLPIITALQTARDTIGNAYIVSQFDAVLAQVRSGVSLSAALESVDGFQRKLCSSIAVGEETGQLDSMLDSIADSMEYDAQQASRRMMTILEPMLIVLMAFVVGFIIIAVMAPIIGSYSAIEGTGTV